MEEGSNNSPKEKIFKKMFDSQKDTDEKLYKNTLFTFSNEIKNKKYSNINELTHDSLLRRMAMEDYNLFPPKNDSLLITDDETLIGKEDPEKLYEEEVNYLRSINQINYLTFSPFGDSFFPYKCKNNKIENNKQNFYEEKQYEDNLHPYDRENKILDIIDFDYNNYEINNDLLFNISMGFIDMSKLKKENVVRSELFVPRSERFNNGRKLVNTYVRKKPEVEDKDEYDYDVEFKSGLMENILKFVNMNENNEFFSKTINNFYKDFTQMQNMNKNIEKNKLLLKWEKIFIDRQKMYKNYLVELQKKERRKRKQQKIQKEIDEKIHQEKLKQYEQEKEFLNELEKIRKKVRQKRRNSVEERKKNMKLSLRGSFSGDGKDPNYTLNYNDSMSSIDYDYYLKNRHGKTIYQKRRTSEERDEWLKTKKKDYFFFNY